MKHYIVVAVFMMAAVSFLSFSGCDRAKQNDTPTAQKETVKARPTVAQRLMDTDPEERNGACLDIVDMGYRGAPHVPRLIELLVDEKQFVRKNAAIALGSIGQTATAAVPALHAIVTQYRPSPPAETPPPTGDDAEDQPTPAAEQKNTPPPSNRVPLQAALALGRIGPAAAVAIPDLIFHMGGIDETMADAATEAMGGIGEAAIAPLTKALGSKDNSLLRRNAAVALGYLSPLALSAVPRLTAALRDADDGVRAAAVVTLGKIGPLDERVVPAVIDTLRDDTPLVRGATLEAMRIMGSPASQALIKEIQSGDATRKERAIPALKEVAPRVYRKYLEEQQENQPREETKTGTPQGAPAE